MKIQVKWFVENIEVTDDTMDVPEDISPSELKTYLMEEIIDLVNQTRSYDEIRIKVIGE